MIAPRSPQRPASHPGTVFVAALAGLGALLWLLRARSFHPDGLDYAQAVKTGHDLLHPHHLLYSPAAWLIHRATPLDPIASCQLLQILATLVLAIAAWRFAARRLDSAPRAAAAVVLLLATRGVLLYATWLEVYLPALALALLAADEALRPDGRTLPLALSLAGAILFHQMAVLMVPPLLVARWRSGRVVRSVALAGAITLAAYLVAAPHHLFDFVFHYAQAGVPGWGEVSNLGPRGWRDVGSNLIDAVAPLPAALEAPGAIVAWICVLGLAGLALRVARRGSVEVPFAALWLFVHLLFVLWWLPSELDLYVLALAPLWMLAVDGWRSRPAWLSARSVLGLAALLAALNLAASVLPNRRGEDPARLEADCLQAAAPADAVIVTTYPVQQNLIYFHDRTETLEWSAEVRLPKFPPGRRPVVLPAAAPDPDARPDWQRWRSVLARDRASITPLPGCPGYELLSARP